MLLIELGQILAEKRESLGKTVEDVSIATKISDRIIVALESGDREILSYGVYIRNYVKCYGIFLGYKQEELLEMMDDISDLYEETPTENKNIKMKEFIKKRDNNDDEDYEKTGKMNSSSKVIFIAALILCIVGVGGFFFLSKEDNPQEAFDSAGVTLEFLGDPTVGIVDATGMAENDTQGVAENSGELEQDLIAEGMASETLLAGRPENDGEITGLAQTNVEPIADAVPDQVVFAPLLTMSPLLNDITAVTANKVVLSAVEDCWLHLEIDGLRTRQMLLTEGAKHTVFFRDTLSVRLGNAGGVRIVYNGEVLAPAGALSEVRTLTFPM